MSSFEAQEVTRELVLAAEEESRSRKGFSGSQNNVAASIARGAQKDFDNAPNPPVNPNLENGAAERPREFVKNMSLGGVPVTVKPVDRRTIEGSTPGDSRQRGK